MSRAKALRRMSAKGLRAAGVLVVALVVTAASADDTVITATFDSAAQFEQCFRDTSIDAVTSPGQVVLAPTEMVLTQMGDRISKVSFGGQKVGRDVFGLDAVQATAATLYFFNGTGGVSLNGNALAVGALPYGGWSTATVNPAWLIAGSNELRFTSGFTLGMDLNQDGAGVSQISSNGGATWQAASGPYLAHLRLWSHPSSGLLTSPVIDLANPDGHDAIRPQLDVTNVQIIPTANTPAATGIVLEARSGSTPLTDATWSNWTSAAGVAPARYVQWRASLETTNGAQTPALNSVEVRADAHVLAPANGGLTIQQFDNQHIVRSSLPYTYQGPSANLVQLRQQFDLDGVVAAGTTDMEKLVLLRNWVRRQWPGNDAGSGIRTWNALEILNAPAGQHGMCVHFATVFSQCALALGYTARPIVLNGHFVADVWSDEYRKWVLMDVEAINGGDLNKYATGMFLDKDTRVPLDAVELHRAVVEGTTANVTQQVYMMVGGTFKMVERAAQDMGVFSYFAYVNRNNHIDQLQPWEEYHGEDYYHSDQYQWWTDTATPLCAEYSGYTNRDEDFNPTLDQAQLTLTATADPSKLSVLVQTFTPNFDVFEYRLDGGAWTELGGLGSDSADQYAALTWLLHVDANMLEVRTRNLWGLYGPASTVQLIGIPEPATLALLGLGALAVVRRKK